MPDRSSSLFQLAGELKSRGVPSISVLTAQIAGVEEFLDFRKLIVEFLPDFEQEILNETTPGAQIAIFCSHFEDLYFPLEEYFKDGAAEDYGDLTRRIPLVVYGVGWEEYEEIASQAREGIQLMTYLLENPHEEYGGTNVSLAEACLEHVPRDLLERVPEGGLSDQEARALLNGTPYEGLALWADRIMGGGDNFFINTDWEMFAQGVGPEWSIEEVEACTRDWHEFTEITDRMFRFVDWLEADLAGRFEELLNFILEKKSDEQTPER